MNSMHIQYSVGSALQLPKDMIQMDPGRTPQKFVRLVCAWLVLDVCCLVLRYSRLAKFHRERGLASIVGDIFLKMGTTKNIPSNELH